MKSLFFFIWLFCCASIVFAQPEISYSVAQSDTNLRIDLSAVCQGEEVTLTSSFKKNNIKQFNWKVNDQEYFNTSVLKLDTLNLLGSVSILSEVIYVDKKYRMVNGRKELCDITCHAYTQILLNVLPCKQKCPQVPKINLSSSVVEYDKEPVYLTLDVESKIDYEVFWKSTSPNLQIKNKQFAVLHPDNNASIDIEVFVKTRYEDCQAYKKITLFKKPLYLPRFSTYSCDLKTSRVDNRCKAVLTAVIRDYQQNKGRKIVIVYGSLQTAQNIKKSLSSNNDLGIAVDHNVVELQFKQKSSIVILVYY